MSVDEQGDATALRVSGAEPPWYLGVETRRTAAGAAVCRLTGDLDLGSSAPVRTALEAALESGASPLIVDLERVQFCDSSGLNLLLQVRLAAQAAGVSLRLAGLTDSVARVFEITGAAGVFSIHASAEEAEHGQG
jgi:anti-anti-sigma factor